MPKRQATYRYIYVFCGSTHVGLCAYFGSDAAAEAHLVFENGVMLEELEGCHVACLSCSLVLHLHTSGYLERVALYRASHPMYSEQAAERQNAFCGRQIKDESKANSIAPNKRERKKIETTSSLLNTPLLHWRK